MNDAYLLIGGNLGDRLTFLRQAFKLIEQSAGRIVAQSSIYETAAWGMENQPAFLNQVVLLNTDHQPKALLNDLLAIEEKLGRQRAKKYGPREIDIDILLFKDEIIDEPQLKIPHPFLPTRRFALIPLAELAPALIHPTTKKTIQQLLDSCPDTLPVEKFALPA